MSLYRESRIPGLAESNRRDFIRKLVAGGLMVPFAAAVTSLLGLRTAHAQKSGGAAKMVSEKAPMAGALGYKCDATKVDLVKFPKRKGAEGKIQYCDNCQLYTGTDKSSGTCSMFSPGENRVCAKG